MRFALEGRIDSVGAADLFLFLSLTQRTSVVAFERADQETRVFFVEGEPVWCLSSRPQLQIEGRLAVGGGLKLRDIESALVRQRAGANRIPQALISEKMATVESMAADLKALASDALRDLAAWNSGTFTIYDGVIPPPWAHAGVLDFTALLIDALRAQCQKETLQKEFVSRRCVPRVRRVARSTTGLNDIELAILALINSERTIEEIVSRSGVGELAALSALHGLCALHLVDVRTAEAAPTPSPAAPSAAPAPPGRGPTSRGGATNEFVEAPPEPKRPSSPAIAAPPESPPAREKDEATARLPVVAEPVAPQPVTHVLRVISDSQSEELVLSAATFAIGRHPRNDLVLKDPRISSFHCRIERDEETAGFVVVDLKSRNGTLLRGARIDRAALASNDVIQLGSTRISYTVR